jgi:hypothetical protein
MATTPMVFSSQSLTASSAVKCSRPAASGAYRGSTSQYRANFSQTTWTFAPITRFGRSVGLPAARIRSRQRHFSASPPSITASLEPVVDVPVGGLPTGACHRSEMIATQRDSISAVIGYSSLSIMFLSNVSANSLSAVGSIHVVTNVARFCRAFPSSINISCTIS